ncbi:hypothetical protein [Labrys neptuniae]
MAARDEWSSSLECPKCGKTGEVTFSEDDHPWMKGDTWRIESISPGFEVRTYGRTASETQFECVDCKELARK